MLIRKRREPVFLARRVEAFKRLGWRTIPARYVDQMSDEELLDLELEENTERLDLEPYDRDKRCLAEIRQAEADAKREAELREESSRNSRGRPPEPGSRRDVGERTGIVPAVQRSIECHVAVAEQYPVMQNTEAGSAKYRVLEAGEKLEAIPDAGGRR